MKYIFILVLVLIEIVNRDVYSMEFLKIKNETQYNFKIKCVESENAYYFNCDNYTINSGKSVVIQFCPKIGDTKAGIDLSLDEDETVLSIRWNYVDRFDYYPSICLHNGEYALLRDVSEYGTQNLLITTKDHALKYVKSLLRNRTEDCIQQYVSVPLSEQF